jgi:hypothetical protein
MNTKIKIFRITVLLILFFPKKGITQCSTPLQAISKPQIISLYGTRNKGEFKLFLSTEDTVERNIYIRELESSNSFDYTKVFKKYTSNSKNIIDSISVQVPDNNKQYCFQVEAVDSKCPARNSELRSPQEVCTTPITVSSKSGNVYIEWKKSPNEFIGGNKFHSYKIERFFDTDDEFLSKSFPIITKIDSLKFVDYGLKCDERYKYKVTTYSSSTNVSSLIKSSSTSMIQVVANDIPSKISRVFSTVSYDNKSLFVQGQFNTNGNVLNNIKPNQYKFYRSNSIGGAYSLQYTGTSLFNDLNAEVNKQSYCYYMTWTNLCEVESEASEKVCTVFLKNNNGTLEWTKEPSLSVPTDDYIISQVDEKGINLQQIEILPANTPKFVLERLPLNYGEDMLIQIEARPKGWNIIDSNSLPSTLSNIIRVYKKPLANETDLSQSLKVYPIPSQDIIMVELQTDKLGKLNWTLNNVVGNTLSQGFENENKNNHQVQIDLRRLSKGIYFLRLQVGEEFFVRKIVKE